MSFGSESGRTRSGTKGFSNKEKKQKRKKQEFHSHKRAYLQGGERADPEEVRARTVLALDRLGHQVLSTEPGGYDLEDWSRNFNALLDDFEEKVGPASITDEFRARRQEAVGYLVPSATADDIDSEIERLTEEERDARALLDEVEKQAADEAGSLREERDACGRDAEGERERLSELTEARQSRQFFSASSGRPRPPRMRRRTCGRSSPNWRSSRKRSRGLGKPVRRPNEMGAGRIRVPRGPAAVGGGTDEAVDLQ